MVPIGAADLGAPAPKALTRREAASTRTWLTRMASVAAEKEALVKREAEEHAGAGWDRRRERRMRLARKTTTGVSQQHQWHVTVPKPFNLSSTNRSKAPQRSSIDAELSALAAVADAKVRAPAGARGSAPGMRRGRNANPDRRRRGAARRGTRPHRSPHRSQGTTEGATDPAATGVGAQRRRRGGATPPAKAPWSGTTPLPSPLSTAREDDVCAALRTAAILETVDDTQVLEVLRATEMEQRRKSAASVALARNGRVGGAGTPPPPWSPLPPWSPQPPPGTPRGTPGGGTAGRAAAWTPRAPTSEGELFYVPLYFTRILLTI